MRPLPIALLLACCGCAAAPSQDAGIRAPAPVKAAPSAEIDLTTGAGAAQAGVSWRYKDALPVKSGSSFEIQPRAGSRDFDDSRWEMVKPEELRKKRGAGKLCFGWYRTQIVVPAEIDGRPTSGARVDLEIVVDDYAEIWVDGALPRELGQAGGSVVAGFNVPNRVTLTENLAHGKPISVAVFAMNGPISDSPENFIFVRSAKLILTWQHE